MLERIVELRKELASHPTSRQFYQLGELLRRQGDAAEAAAVLHEGLEHHPRYVAAWVSLGRARVDLQDAVGAVSALDRALALDASNPVAWRLLGEARLLAGDRPGALEAMEHALALVPGDQVLEAAVDTLRRERTTSPSEDVPREGEDESFPGGTLLSHDEEPPGFQGQGAGEFRHGFESDSSPHIGGLVPEFSEVAPLEAPGILLPHEATPPGERRDGEPEQPLFLADTRSAFDGGEGLPVPLDDPFGGPGAAEAAPFPSAESVGPSHGWDVFAPPDQPIQHRAMDESDQAAPASGGNWDITVTVSPPLTAEDGAAAVQELAAHGEPSEAEDPGAFGVLETVAAASAADLAEKGTADDWPGPHGAGADRELLEETETDHSLEVEADGSEEKLSAAGEPVDVPWASEPAPVSEAPLALVAEVETIAASPAAPSELLLSPGLHVVPPGQGQEVPGEVEPAPASTGPQPTLTLARLFIQQHHLDQAVAVLNEMITLEPGNQEARDLRALVVDMMEPLDGPLPVLSLRERKIAALQRWAASLTLSRDRMTP